MKLTKVHLAALAFVAGVLPAAVYADGWFSRAGDKKDVTLTDVLKTPREYVDVEVKFKVYFDAAGKNFNPYFTRFNEECYGNFSAYPIDARLYDKRDFPRPYPFFFASKMDKTWKKVKDVDHLRVIEITGVVRDIFQGQPWIEVLDWSGSGGGLSEDDIRDVVRADANFVAGNYKDAARLYERADSSSLPGTVRADLQRRLGDAYYQAGEYGDAQDAYQTGLRYAPDSVVLKQGADASETARQRAKASRRGETVEGDVPEIAPAEQAVIESNGTDEVIRLLEDPAKVQAEVDAWRQELAARAAAVRGDAPDAVAVAGTQEEPAPTPAPEEPVAEEPVAEPEPVPAEEAPEACAEEAPAPENVEEPAEEPAVAEPVQETPAEVAEEPQQQQPEQPEGTPESGATEESDAGEAACGGVATDGCATTEDTAEVVDEGTAEITEESGSEATEEGSSEGCAEEACGCSESEEGGETAVPAEDETVAVPNDERVVWVSGQMLRLPRLPFFGCEDVTDDDLRAIIEEVVQNPESDE